MACQSLLFLLVLGVVSYHTHAFQCYSCDSSVDSNNKETGNIGCVNVVNVNATVNTDNQYCVTVYTKRTSASGGFDISRYGSTGERPGTYCETTSSTTACYCPTEKCNGQPVVAPLECYVCSSSLFFETGCGREFDQTKGYFKKVQGCNACFKTISVNSESVVTYTRGCLRGFPIETGCSGDVTGAAGQRCTCTNNLCNSAENLIAKKTNFFFITFVSIVIKSIY